MTNPRPAPTSIRFTGEHRKLIDAALKIAGIRKTMKGWFPRLLVIVLTDYVANHLAGAK
jgi:hypothetical protein